MGTPLRCCLISVVTNWESWIVFLSLMDRHARFDRCALLSQSKQTSPGPVLINRYQHSLFDLVLELADRLGDQSPDGFRKNVLRSNLYHAGSVPARGGKYSSEIKIMRQDRIAATLRISHDVGIGRSRCANGGPMHRIPAFGFQHGGFWTRPSHLNILFRSYVLIVGIVQTVEIVDNENRSVQREKIRLICWVGLREISRDKFC